jgi:ATP-dependent Clp protease ATP-binding subunit ClpB
VWRSEFRRLVGELRWTLLFDEIEKAHERVLELCLQLLSAARLTLGSGRVLNLEKVYVTSTSNIGSPLLVGSKTNLRETLVRRVIQDARDQMRPEIFDRFDRVLVFNRLSYEVQIEVGRLHLTVRDRGARTFGKSFESFDGCN